MIIEICAAMISISFVALVVFIIMTVQSSRKELKHLQRDLDILVQNMNELTEDLKQKSDSLNVIFRFIDRFNQKKSGRAPPPGARLQNKTEKITEVIDLVGSGVDLFNRIKRDFKRKH